MSIREYPRVAATCRVRFRTMDQLVNAYCQDLSKGGMLVSTPTALPVNAVVRVQIELPDGGATIEVISRVVHVRDRTDEKGAKGCLMGVQFLDLGGDRQGQLERFIADAIVVGPVLDAPPLSLLVIDDEEAWREAAAEPFKKRGDLVRLATDGLEGLAQCLKGLPDIVLLDVQMPRMDGWQLLRMMRARPSLAAAPVIFLTAITGDDERLLAYQLGVDDFLPKPFRAEELVARVDRITRRLRQPTHAHGDRKTLRGDLEHVSLPSVLAFLELERKTGELLLVGPATATIYLRDGRIMRVEREGAPKNALSKLLLQEVLFWRAGQFEFALRDVVVPDELAITTTALLLDHARRSDEAAADIEISDTDF